MILRLKLECGWNDGLRLPGLYKYIGFLEQMYGRAAASKSAPVFFCSRVCQFRAVQGNFFPVHNYHFVCPNPIWHRDNFQNAVRIFLRNGANNQPLILKVDGCNNFIVSRDNGHTQILSRRFSGKAITHYPSRNHHESDIGTLVYADLLSKSRRSGL